MAKLLGVLKSAWFMTLLGLLLLSILIWVFGPSLGIAGREPLASPVARLLTILGLVAVWGVVLQVQQLRLRSRARKMGNALTSQATSVDEHGSVAAAERAHLETRFREAVAILRRRRGRVSLYALPWYVVIGPPGSGKSTLIRNSGLQFPLGGQFGKEALRGVGGTRNCDWWFTDEAVFLDTAGRYTTQDSDRQLDAEAWVDFLRLLRRFRRNRPVNGVLVTMSMSDLLLQDEIERDQHVQAVRRRLDELAEHLKISVPVYLVFTKCDLLAGFTEFFDNLNPEQRGQVWGTSFPVAKTLNGTAARTFAAEFNLLLDRINARLVDRLHSERDHSRRAAILSFPQELAAFGEIAREFTEDVFAGHAYGPPLLLRGVYLTSGTQEGTPIDRMMSAVARTFGVDEARLHTPGIQSRTFFVERLLREVVFSESGFAGENPDAERRRRLRHAFCYVGIVAASASLLALLGTSYLRNAAYMVDVQAALDARPNVGNPAHASTPQQFFALALQNLEGLRPVVDVARRYESDVPFSMRAGLYQGHEISRQVHDAYVRELNSALLPGIGAQFRRGLAGNAGDLQALYYYLKGYLMLGQPEHADATELAALASIEWQRLFPQDPVLQQALDAHFRKLLDRPERLRALPLDEEQVARARNTLRSADLAMLVYSSLKLDTQAQFDDDARLDKALGLLGGVFHRASGLPLSTPWPALYTQPVFASQVHEGIDDLVERFLADDWVFDTRQADPLTRPRTVQQVIALYEQDYIRAWDALLTDLKIGATKDLQDASMLAAKLSGQGSPLRLLLKLVKTHTSNMLPVADAASSSAADGVTAAATKMARAQVARRSAVLATTMTAVLADKPAQPKAVPGRAIEAHFASLNLLTDGEPGATPLDHTLGVIDQLGKVLLTMTEFNAGQPNPQLLLAQQEASQLPWPASGWIAGLTGAAGTLVASGTRDALGEHAREAIGADCAEFVRGRYPFDPSSTVDIPLQNFGELFGYGGRFDSLFQQSLARLIDTSGGTWRWRDVPGMAEGPPGLPAQMQAADRIKRNYFREGQQLDVRFTLRTASMVEPVARVVIEIDGQEAMFIAGSDLSVPMRWPGPAPGRARISAFDAAGAPLGQIGFDGSWALFRLLQSQHLRRRSDLEFVAHSEFGHGAVDLSLLAGSLRHPFLDTTLQRFRCEE